MTSLKVKPSISPGWKNIFRALNYRNFRLYWAGQIISQTGTWMQIVAQSWLVYRLTDSPLMLGLVNFIALLPVLPVSLIAGAISDRFSRRVLMLITEIVLAAQALVFALLIWSNLIQIWHIIMLNFILGSAAALEQPARLALVAETVNKDDLPNAIALNSSVYNSAQIIGPAIAGVLVGLIGEAGCIGINGISYIAVVIALLAMKLSPKVFNAERLRVAHSILEGLQYIWREKTIRGLMMIVSLASFFTLPYLTMMPIFAKDILKAGPQGLGVLMTSAGIGSIIGALLAGSRRPGKRGQWLTWGNILGPTFLLIFCLSHSYVVSIMIVLFVGASGAVRQTLANSLLQIISPEEYHGRVMSIFNLLFNGMSRVGALSVGGLAEITSAPLALGASAGLSVVLGMLMIFVVPEVYRTA